MRSYDEVNKPKNVVLVTDFAEQKVSVLETNC